MATCHGENWSWQVGGIFHILKASFAGEKMYLYMIHISVGPKKNKDFLGVSRGIFW